MRPRCTTVLHRHNASRPQWQTRCSLRERFLELRRSPTIPQIVWRGRESAREKGPGLGTIILETGRRRKQECITKGVRLRKGEMSERSSGRFVDSKAVRTHIALSRFVCRPFVSNRVVLMNEKDGNEFIRVYCRVRPYNQKEDKGICSPSIGVSRRRGRRVHPVQVAHHRVFKREYG